MQLSVFFILLESLRMVSALQTSPASCREAGMMSFAKFVKKFDRAYKSGSAEYARRQTIFEKHSKAISDHNCGPLANQWTVTVNHMADWTDAELKALNGYKRGANPGVLSLNRGNASRVSIGSESIEEHSDPLPKQFGWAHLNSMKDISDQGSCGSCWAHSAAACMNAQYEIATGVFRKVSMSQLLFCTPNPRHCGGNGGCSGATNELAYDYALKVPPVWETQFGDGHSSCGEGMSASPEATSASFDNHGTEFHNVPGSHLVPGMSHRATDITGWTKFAENKQAPLMTALVNFGPVGVAVAPGYFWSFYSGGVMSNEGCDPDHVISHAVVLMGYGETGNSKYWHIKNSWGRFWGEHGHLRLVRTDHEEQTCGWDNKPEEGNGCVGGPPRVRVCGTCGILFDTSMPVYQK